MTHRTALALALDPRLQLAQEGRQLVTGHIAMRHSTVLLSILAFVRAPVVLRVSFNDAQTPLSDAREALRAGRRPAAGKVDDADLNGAAGAFDPLRFASVSLSP